MFYIIETFQTNKTAIKLMRRYTFMCAGSLRGKHWTAQTSMRQWSALSFRTLQFCLFSKVYKPSNVQAFILLKVGGIYSYFGKIVMDSI